MKLLLDTHVLLWWYAGDDRIGPALVDRVEAPDTEVLVSMVSLWEILIKMRVGKLEIDFDALDSLLALSGFRKIGIEQRHLAALARLPMHHRDPFDHLLMAQAIVEGAAFVTADRQAGAYPLAVIACR